MKIPFASLSHKSMRQVKALQAGVQLNWKDAHLSVIQGMREARTRKSPDIHLEVPGSHLRCAPRDDGGYALAFELFVGDDLDAEAGQSLVGVHRRRQMTNRGDAEIAQDLGPDADLAPLPVAVGFGGPLLRQRRNRNPGGAISQVNQHTAAGFLEVFEHDLYALRPGEDVLDDIGLVEPGQHVLAVADAIIDESDVRDGIERRAISVTLQRPDRAFRGECRDPLDQFLARLAVGDHIGDGDVLELVAGWEPRPPLAP